MATAWHETAFPVPAHAAAITGEIMEERRAATTVMDKNRRMLLAHYTLSFAAKAMGFSIKAINFLNFHQFKQTLPCFGFTSYLSLQGASGYVGSSTRDAPQLVGISE